MSVSTQYSPVSYNGDGVTTAFAFNWSRGTGDTIVVTEVVIATGVETVKTINTHYTVTSSGPGTVTAVTAPASTVKWVISRLNAKTQLTDYVENDPLPANTLEAAFDNVTLLGQENAYNLTRCLRQPDGDSTTLARLPIKATRASKYMAFDANGDPIVSSGTTSILVTTPFIETLLDDTTAAAARTTLAVPAATSGTLTSPTLLSPIVTGIQGGTAIQRKRKTADESLNTSATLQDDNHLVLAVDGLEEWVGTLHLSVGAALTNTGFKLAMTAPAGATLLVTTIIAGDILAKSIGNTTTTSGQELDATTTTLAGCTNAAVTIHFWVLNGATPGNLTLQWAQSTSHASNVTVRKGSCLFAERVA